MKNVSLLSTTVSVFHVKCEVFKAHNPTGTEVQVKGKVKATHTHTHTNTFCATFLWLSVSSHS